MRRHRWQVRKRIKARRQISPLSSRERHNEPQSDKGIEAGNRNSETDFGHHTIGWKPDLSRGHYTSLYGKRPSR
jgi:hypothetical protein